MNIFKTIDEKISYTDIIQLDGAYAVAHMNYGKSPEFNKMSGKDIEKSLSNKGKISKEVIENVVDSINEFKGTEKT